MTTRRSFLRGAAAAVPAAALAGVARAAPADVDERLRLAVQELEAAMLAKWPGHPDVRIVDYSLQARGTCSPMFFIVAHEGDA